MASKNQDDEKGVQERLSKILAGAFSGPPTPLKAIPKKTGESRKLSKKLGGDKRRPRAS